MEKDDSKQNTALVKSNQIIYSEISCQTRRCELERTVFAKFSSQVKYKSVTRKLHCCIEFPRSLDALDTHPYR